MAQEHPKFFCCGIQHIVSIRTYFISSTNITIEKEIEQIRKLISKDTSNSGMAVITLNTAQQRIYHDHLMNLGFKLVAGASNHNHMPNRNNYIYVFVRYPLDLSTGINTGLENFK